MTVINRFAGVVAKGYANANAFTGANRYDIFPGGVGWGLAVAADDLKRVDMERMCHGACIEDVPVFDRVEGHLGIDAVVVPILRPKNSLRLIAFIDTSAGLNMQRARSWMDEPQSDGQEPTQQ